jgi:lipoprotein-releasing system permease protein
LGVAVMFLTVGIVMGFKHEIIRKITGLTTHIVVSNVSRGAGNEPEPVTISEDTLRMLRELPYVKHIQKTAFKNGLLKTEEENEGILLKGVERSYDFSYLKQHLREGRLPEFSDEEASRDILISEALSRRMGLSLNDKMQVYFISRRELYDSLSKQTVIKSEMRSRRFSVCGIFKTNFADFDDKLSLVDIRQVRQISNWDQQMTGNFEIQLSDFSRLEEVQEEIEDLLGYSYDVSNVTELYANIFIWLDKLDINGVIIIVLMVLVAVVNMITALLILILERTNMVGLMKTLGMSNAGVRRIFLHISFRLIGKGLLWGNLIGLSLCLLQYHFKWVSLDSATYYVEHVVVELNYGYFLLLNAGTLLVCFLMLLLPTLLLTRLTPVKTLRFD